jgi:hypothetical protein
VRVANDPSSDNGRIASGINEKRLFTRDSLDKRRGDIRRLADANGQYWSVNSFHDLPDDRTINVCDNQSFLAQSTEDAIDVRQRFGRVPYRTGGPEPGKHRNIES